MSSKIVVCRDCKYYDACLQSGRVEIDIEPICENFSELTCGDCRSYEYCSNALGFEFGDPICECFHIKRRLLEGKQYG